MVTWVSISSQVGSTVTDRDIDVGSGAPSASSYLILSDEDGKEIANDSGWCTPDASAPPAGRSFEPVEQAGSSGRWMYPLLPPYYVGTHTSEIAFGSEESVSNVSSGAWRDLSNPGGVLWLSGFELGVDHTTSSFC